MNWLDNVYEIVMVYCVLFLFNSIIKIYVNKVLFY